MRARRLVAVASVAVGLVALAGCRTEPGVAAYVGDVRITETAVDAIVQELATASPAPQAPGEPPAERPEFRRPQIVSTLVLHEVCQRVSADKGYRAQTPPEPEQVRQALGLAPGSVFAQRQAELNSCLSGLPVGSPVAPTQEEMTDLVEAGKTAGVIPAEVTVEQAAGQLDGDQLRRALAAKKSLGDAVGDYDVTVNPRYRPLEFPVLSFNSDAPAVSVLLGEEGTGAVTDVSTPDPLPSVEPTDGEQVEPQPGTVDG
ncbi:hypothetical protein [Micromonospora endolithica]|uniref:Lipoprotein n=1 Tax=Micromonospora endolithica TaxID=230091 RepID=A0A3A9Z5Q0_9ACTN|nr:hypothetical protein [Micromonospora endolithica]RKN43598.1 hypothetical protein D7223_20375 [Micromonospora endolithica]TWJ23982.1 hypothetical protein JD76_04128 [Micromonospora endolithica]